MQFAILPRPLYMTQKTALITGASVGIGEATARHLHALGFSLILVARRKEKLDKLNSELGGKHAVYECDVNDKGAILTLLEGLTCDVDVLLNNAGLALGLDSADKSNWDHWETMINTNCLALAYLTRQLLPKMVARNRGHIINLGSIAGTYAYKGGNVYGATKAFVEQFSLGLLADLMGTAIKVTNLEPGLIGGTEFSNVRYEGDDDKASSMYTNCQPLTANDIAQTIGWLVTQPEHVNVNRMEIMPVCQAPAGVSVYKEES